MLPLNFQVPSSRLRFFYFLVADAKAHYHLFVQASFPLIALVLLLVSLPLLLLLSLLRLFRVVLVILEVSFHLLLVAAYSQ